MKQASLLLLCLLLRCHAAISQTVSPPWHSTTHATLFGIGGVNHLDTYLSPQEYHGLQVSVLHETFSPTRWFQGRLSAQSLWTFHASTTKNSVKNANELGGSVTYDHAWHYHWLLPLGDAESHPTLRLMAGPQVGGLLGFLYNTRNGNNPAQAQANIHLSASVAAIMQFSLWKRPFAVRNQLDVPMIGAMFIPQYGQSYYEIFSEGNSDHNIAMTTLFNSPCLRNLFTLDFPIGNVIMRAGYMLDIHQAHVNNIKQHRYSHAFVLGWVKHFTLHKRKNIYQDGFML